MNQFIYPVPFDDFVGFRRKQAEAISSSYNLKQLSKIRKLKKLLQTTEQKICNRIKLFKKASNDIQRKKEKQNHLLQRIQNVKKHHQYYSPKKQKSGSNCLWSAKTSVLGPRNRETNQSDKLQNNNKKLQELLQQKHDNAKEIKMWKQRNKVLVEQRKIKQMRQKIKSANIIRSHRNKAKQIKMQCQHEKLQEARKLKQQKSRQQVQKFDELQMNLTRLQRQEREALIAWKQTMEQCS